MANLKIRKILHKNITGIDFLGPTDLKLLEMVNVLDKGNGKLPSLQGMQIMFPHTELALET